MQYDFAVLNGRFRPPTKAHIDGIIRPALQLADRLIVNIGSCYAPRSIRNPWQGYEVREMLKAALTESEHSRLIVNYLPDFTYNDAKWISEVQRLVEGNFDSYGERVALVGHSKDNTSYYLKLFPQWDCIDVGDYNGINATDARELFFSGVADWSGHIYKALQATLPEKVIEYLYEWRKNNTSTFINLVDEKDFIAKYKQEWGEGPFLTGDGVVIQGGHVLMVTRGRRPGKGLLALPGGFMNKNETLLECAVRETYEETKLDMPQGAFAGSFVTGQTFDLPHRDPRARIITYAALFDLTHELDRKAAYRKPSKALQLTKVKGSDDADKAEWIALSKLRSEDVFADHYHIIQKMVSLL